MAAWACCARPTQRARIPADGSTAVTRSAATTSARASATRPVPAPISAIGPSLALASARKKARRWVVERAHSWMNRFRAVLVRWNKKAENYLAMLHFALAVIAYRSAGLFG